MALVALTSTTASARTARNVPQAPSARAAFALHPPILAVSSLGFNLFDVLVLITFDLQKKLRARTAIRTATRPMLIAAPSPRLDANDALMVKLALLSQTAKALSAMEEYAVSELTHILVVSST